MSNQPGQLKREKTFTQKYITPTKNFLHNWVLNPLIDFTTQGVIAKAVDYATRGLGNLGAMGQKAIDKYIEDNKDLPSFKDSKWKYLAHGLSWLTAGIEKLRWPAQYLKQMMAKYKTVIVMPMTKIYKQTSITYTGDFHTPKHGIKFTIQAKEIPEVMVAPSGAPVAIGGPGNFAPIVPTVEYGQNGVEGKTSGKKAQCIIVLLDSKNPVSGRYREIDASDPESTGPFYDALIQMPESSNKLWIVFQNIPVSSATKSEKDASSIIYETVELHEPVKKRIFFPTRRIKNIQLRTDTKTDEPRIKVEFEVVGKRLAFDRDYDD